MSQSLLKEELQELKDLQDKVNLLSLSVGQLEIQKWSFYEDFKVSKKNKIIWEKSFRTSMETEILIWKKEHLLKQNNFLKIFLIFIIKIILI